MTWFSFTNLLKRAKRQATGVRHTTGRNKRRTPKTSYRLTIEPLEDRAMPSFLAPVSYPGGGGAAVAVGDFTGTGVADLVVANGASVSVFLGKGDGTFAPAQNYAVDGGAESVAVGDFNNDGKLDIITVNYFGFVSASTVSVLLGNGNGTFQPAVNYGVPAGIPQSANLLAVGDFNKDGKLDVAVAGNVYTNGGYSSTPYVNVLIGNGAGGFSADNSYALPSGAYGWEVADGVAVGDFTGNGNLDLAVATDSGVDVLLGNGDGTFGAPTNFATSGWAFAVAVGDFNGDGKADIATAAGDGIDVLMGNGNGTFAPAVNYPTVYPSSSIALADFNRDGKLDVVTTSNGTPRVFLGFGDGTFAPAQEFAVGEASSAVA